MSFICEKSNHVVPQGIKPIRVVAERYPKLDLEPRFYEFREFYPEVVNPGEFLAPWYDFDEDEGIKLQVGLVVYPEAARYSGQIKREILVCPDCNK